MGGDRIVAVEIGGGCLPRLARHGESCLKAPRSSTLEKVHARASPWFRPLFVRPMSRYRPFTCVVCGNFAFSPFPTGSDFFPYRLHFSCCLTFRVMRFVCKLFSPLWVIKDTFRRQSLVFARYPYIQNAAHSHQIATIVRSTVVP